MQRLHATLIKHGPLSPKEAVVLRHLCEGRLRKEIALKVFRTASTVGKQIESISRKLECHCAAEVVAKAVAMGLVRVELVEDYRLSIKCVAVLLIVNAMTSHFDIPRGPRSPRPIRTTRLISRVVRQQNQYT